MRRKRLALTLMTVLVLGLSGWAQSFTTIYEFTGGSDGGYPLAGVIQDNRGNLYGTTTNGGTVCAYGGVGCGVVFRVDTAGSEHVLYSFTEGADEFPYASLFEYKGKFYGTTYGGDGCGTLYEVDKAGTESDLYQFRGGNQDGCEPAQAVVMDSKRDIYTATFYGGTSEKGAIIQRKWNGEESVFYSFEGGASDGAGPFLGGLLMDKKGDLYGVTEFGGASNQGVLYKVGPKGRETMLYGFAGGVADGCYPYGTPAEDKAGNLYGTTEGCGAFGGGIIWKVSPDGHETILHNFAGGPSDGANPFGGVVLDTSGNLYGATVYGGASAYYGTVYEVTASGTLTLLHSFDNSDGANPIGEVIRNPNGSLYGTTSAGGSYGAGTVWTYQP